LTKAALQPFKDRVMDRWVDQNKFVKWDAVEQRWQIIVTHAESIMAAFYAGRAGNTHERTAATTVLQLAKDVPVREIVVTVAAVYLHQRAFPSFYVNDRAFRFQLVRALRRLTRAHAGAWFDHVSNRTKYVYKDPHYKAVEWIASWVMQGLGPVGVYLCRKEDALEEEERKARQSFSDALSSVQ